MRNTLEESELFTRVAWGAVLAASVVTLLVIHQMNQDIEMLSTQSSQTVQALNTDLTNEPVPQ